MKDIISDHALTDSVGLILLDQSSRNAGSEFNILFVGDTSFGESYQRKREERGGENILKTRGYASSLLNLQAFMSKADFVLANLETPICDLPEEFAQSHKKWVHKADIEETPKQLLANGIRAVSLANNHSMDYGAEGLAQTFDLLQRYNITPLADSQFGDDRPLIVRIESDKSQLVIAVFAMYVTGGASGIQRYQAAIKKIRKRIRALRANCPKLLTIAFPHWGNNYQWRSLRQRGAAKELVRAGIDIVIGHGAHMIQEITRRAKRWVIYSLGNFVFNSPGRYRMYDAPPFSIAAKLRVTPRGEQWDIRLLLYPLVTDNRITDYRTRFVTKDEFEHLRNVLDSRGSHTIASSWGQDEVGYYLDALIDHRSDLHGLSSPEPVEGGSEGRTSVEDEVVLS